MLKPLIRLYEENREKFEDIESDFRDRGIEWYCEFGSSPPITVEKKNIQ